MPGIDVPTSPPLRRGRHRANSLRLSRNVRASAGRLSWGLGDQAISSLTNFAVGIYVARSLGLVDFGMFTLAWVTYGLVLNISRGLATDPLVVRFSGASAASWRGAVARASATALLVGLGAGAVSILAGAAIGGGLGSAFVALGFVLPALLLQDSWRFAFFACGKGRRAFSNDLVWAVALVPALFFAADVGTVAGFVLAWGLAAAVAAVFGCIQVRVVPKVSETRAWFRQHRDLGLRYLIENVSNSGGGQLRMYGLGAIAGLAEVGAVQGALLLFGPIRAALMGLCAVAVPEAVRALGYARRRLLHFCVFLGGAQAACALVWGLALLVLLPAAVGRSLLGSVWQAAVALILPTMLIMIGISIATGAFAGLRALGAARRSMLAQLFTSVMFVTGGLIGAAAGGAVGSAWGAAIADMLGAAVGWWQLRVALSEPPVRQPLETIPKIVEPTTPIRAS